MFKFIVLPPSTPKAGARDFFPGDVISRLEGAGAGGRKSIFSVGGLCAVLVMLMFFGLSSSASAAPALSSITCATTSMTGWVEDACAVNLSAPAPSGGLSVSLQSTDSGSVMLPNSVTVPAGATSASFTTIVSWFGPAGETVTLTGSGGGVSKNLTVTVLPATRTLSTSASSVSFGSVSTGTAATKTVVVKSTGNLPITISSLALSGQGLTLSSVALPLTLNPAQSVSLTVQFLPTATGAASGSLTITSDNNMNGKTAVVSFSGTAIAATTTPALSGLSCASTSLAGSLQDLCTLTLTKAAPSGGLSVSLSSGSTAVTVPASVVVPAGATTTTFSAAVTWWATSSGSATLTASAGRVTKTLALQLIPATRTFTTSATTLAFGNVAMNTPVTQSVTLKSTGNLSVTVSAVTLTGTGFTVSGATTPVTLNPGQSLALTVQFKPTATGTVTGGLTIASNNNVTGTTSVVALSGNCTGVATVTVSPSSLSFPSSALGVATAPQVVTVKNTGTSTVTLGTRSFTGTSMASFISPTTTCGSSLAAGASCTISVELKPAAAGTLSASLSIANSATGSPLLVALTGTTTAAATPVLSALTCTSSSMTGSGTDACTVTVNAAAPSGGVSVSLSSSSTSVTVPASVTVAANATSASFSATVSSVSTAAAVTLTAGAGSVSKTFALQLAAASKLLSISATTVSFGGVVLDSTSTQTITLKSTGTSAVTINAPTLTGTGYTLAAGTYPLTLNPGQTATLNVQFQPEVTGAAAGKLTITSTSSSGATAVVSLSGTGNPHQVQLTWSAPTSSDSIAGYNIYRTLSGGSTYQLLNTTVDAQTTYMDSIAVSSVTYNYVVKSVDASGNLSAASNVIAVAIP